MHSVFEQVLWVLKKSARSAQKNTQYYINNPKEAWEDLITYARENPKEFVITCSLIAGGVLVIVLPLAIGFGPAGPILGSIAAGWQSGIGAVAAGSLFAVMQSLAMTGVFTGIGATLIALGTQTPLIASLFRSTSHGFHNLGAAGFLQSTIQFFRNTHTIEGPPIKPWFLQPEHTTPNGPTTEFPDFDAEETTKRILETNSRETYDMVWEDMDVSINKSTVKQHAMNGFNVAISFLNGPRIEPGDKGFYERFRDHEISCNANCECTGDITDVRLF